MWRSDGPRLPPYLARASATADEIGTADRRFRKRPPVTVVVPTEKSKSVTEEKSHGEVRLLHRDQRGPGRPDRGSSEERRVPEQRHLGPLPGQVGLEGLRPR